MKIKKFKFKRILKLHLLKSKIYGHYEKKNNSNNVTSITLSHIITNFKKALQVIFQYNQANKRILFIGIPPKLEAKINRLTNHVAVSHSFDLQGVISNTKKSKSFRVKKGTSKYNSAALLPKLIRKPDLIVLFSHHKQESIISESFVAKVPLILFDGKDMEKRSWLSYNVLGIKSELVSSNHENILLLGLNFLFKKFK